MEDLALKYILSTIVYSMLGLILFIISLMVIEKITNFHRKAPAFRHGDIRRSCALALSLRKDFREFISLENLL